MGDCAGRDVLVWNGFDCCAMHRDLGCVVVLAAPCDARIVAREGENRAMDQGEGTARRNALMVILDIMAGVLLFM